MKKILLITGMISILFFSGCTIQNKSTNNIQADIYTISSPQNIYLDGSFQYIQQKIFTDDTTKGTINKIDVSNNQQVKKGQVLYSYKNDQAIEEYNTDTQQLKSLQSEYNQLQQQPNIVDGTTLDNSTVATGTSIQSQLNQNKQQQSSLQQQINEIKDSRYTTITAPFDGVVSLSSDTTKSILTLTNTTMQIVANVSEKDVLKIKVNQKVKVDIYGTNQEIAGTINSIGTQPTDNLSTSDNTSGTTASTSSVSYYPVYININQQTGFYTGFHVQVTTNDEVDLPKIPISAVLNENNKAYVWKVINDKLCKVAVNIQSWNDTYDQINSGLNFGDKIISNPTSEMKEGETVNVSTSGN